MATVEQDEAGIRKAAQRTLMMLVAPAHEWPTDALLHTSAVARQLGADVHVLRLLRGRKVPDDAVGREVEATRQWCERILREPFSAARIHVAAGRFTPRVIAEARELGADLIVIPPGQEKAATQLARRAGIPVMVARSEYTGAGLVAATDLSDADALVARYGVELGERLDEPVVYVNNVGPTLAAVPGDYYVSTIDVPTDQAVVEEHRAELERMAKELGHGGRTIVETCVRASDGVLEAAQECQADLIVVGTHDRPWFDRVLRESAARDVVRRSRKSVVVVPVGRA